MKTLSYQLVHNRLTVNTDSDVWQGLKKRGYTPRCIIDVGASTGLWTKDMLKVYPDSNYLMIDPLQENEQALREVAKNYPNVRYWLGAAGRDLGELEMHAHGPQSSVYASEWGGALRRVPMNTLDALAKEFAHNVVDGMKIDVQGAELEVLAGAAETLRMCKVVQVEVSFRRVYEKAPVAHEIIRFFAEQGFRIFDIVSIVKRGGDGALIQGDLFFVSEDKLFEPETWV